MEPVHAIQPSDRNAVVNCIAVDRKHIYAGTSDGYIHVWDKQYVDINGKQKVHDNIAQ